MPIKINGAEIRQWTFPGGERGLSIVSGASGQLELIRLDYRSSDDLIDLALAVDALRGMNSPIYLRKIIVLDIPYFPYARQDRRASHGESLSVAVIARFINSLELDRVYIEDPHSDVLTSLLNNVVVREQDECFRNALSIAYPRKTTITEYRDGIAINPPGDYDSIKNQDLVLLAPDAGAAKKIYKTAEKLKSPVITAIKHRDTQTGQISGTAIYDQESLRNKDIWVLDDICDGGRTFVELAKAITVPVNSLNLYVTHGIFSKGKEELSKYYNKIIAKNDWTAK